MSRYTDPEWADSALITIDTQCDTLDGQSFEVLGTSDILPQMKTLLEAYRTKRRPIIHIVRLYKSDGSNVDLCRKESVEEGEALLLADSDGCQLTPQLLPEIDVKLETDLLLSGDIQVLGPTEVVMYKPRWGAFYQTSLDRHLRDKGISTLVLSGCNFPNCPRTSIYEASERDYRLVLVEDAVSGLYNQAKLEMQNIGVHLMSTDQVVEALGHSIRA